jgi:enoyl-[acyl-carrier-protein] reductase (NADH)
LRPQWFSVTEKVLLISYYSVERVENTVQDLKKEFEEQKILGMACDVRDSKSIQALVDMAKSKLGHIDIWVTIISFFSDSNASFHFLCTVLAI